MQPSLTVPFPHLRLARGRGLRLLGLCALLAGLVLSAPQASAQGSATGGSGSDGGSGATTPPDKPPGKPNGGPGAPLDLLATPPGGPAVVAGGSGSGGGELPRWKPGGSAAAGMKRSAPLPPKPGSAPLLPPAGGGTSPGGGTDPGGGGTDPGGGDGGGTNPGGDGGGDDGTNPGGTLGTLSLLVVDETGQLLPGGELHFTGRAGTALLVPLGPFGELLWAVTAEHSVVLVRVHVGASGQP